MRYRLMASFQGASYQAGVGPTDEEVTLFAAGPPPEELGFRSSSNHWRKTVRVDDIDALWEARPVGRYRGEHCMVLDDLGDRMHIAYLGRDLYLARRLGFWEVDRGVFEVVVPRQDIDDLREERGEYELAVAGRNGHSQGWDLGSLPTWAHTPREQRQPAPDTGPLRAVGPHGLIDTGPSWAADPRLPDGPGTGGGLALLAGGVSPGGQGPVVPALAVAVPAGHGQFVLAPLLAQVVDVLAGDHDLEHAPVHLPEPQPPGQVEVPAQVGDVHPVAQVVEHDARLAPVSADRAGLPQRVDVVDSHLLAPVADGGRKAMVLGRRGGREQRDVAVGGANAGLVGRP